MQGVKIKMDDAGNVLIRRYSKGNVYVKSTASQPNEETSIGNDIMKLPSQALEMEKIVKVRLIRSLITDQLQINPPPFLPLSCST